MRTAVSEAWYLLTVSCVHRIIRYYGRDSMVLNNFLGLCFGDEMIEYIAI